MPNDSPLVAALLREREGYVRNGDADRVAQVDAQLALQGHKPEPETASFEAPRRSEPETASLEATETATVPRGRPRRSTP